MITIQWSFFYGGIIMKNTLRRRIYIYLHMKFCELTGKKMIKEYTAVYKYKNKIGYFINATGFNKKDCIEKVRTIVFYSGFFNGIKDKRDMQVIVIENEV